MKKLKRSAGKIGWLRCHRLFQRRFSGMHAFAQPLKVMLLLFGLSSLAVLTFAQAHAGIVEYRVLVDDHRRLLPGQPPEGWFYNCMGGDRGLIRDTNDASGTGVAAYSKPTDTVYRGVCTRKFDTNNWEFLGFWQSLGRPLSQRHQFSPAAVLSPLLRPEYRGQLVGLDVRVNRIESPGGYDFLTLKLGLKGFDGTNEVSRLATNYTGRADLTNGPFPRTFSLNVDTNIGPVGVATIMLDYALPGDALEVDDVALRVVLPEVPPNLEPLLFSLAMLLENYDPTTGMVQDRANFPNGDFENVTATAKLAKLLALGIQMGLVDAPDGRDAINNIAWVLLNRAPRGPAGLWPHFTSGGGTNRIAGSEWASGDTAYAINDLMVALQLVGDPQGRLPTCQAFLNSIDWAALHRPGEGYSHGYDTNDLPLPDAWRGFGMETIGVQWAALAGGGPLANMDLPPSDNGSGFILHAAYPALPTGTDRWGNNWPVLRQNEVALQLGWYADPAHSNTFLVTNGLFGLSGAERPEGWHTNDSEIYQAYGTGGRTSPPNDGDRRVVAPHYCGMVASLAPAAASNMWASLKQMGLVSPMNMVESLAMNPSTGELEMVNFLKGSWNLALFCEGWFLAQPGTVELLDEAVNDLPGFNHARRQLFPEDAGIAPHWVPLTSLPDPATSYVFAGAGGTLIAASTKYDEPRLWAAAARTDALVFRELTFDTNLLYNHLSSKQITSVAASWSNGVPHFYAGTSAGVMEVNPDSGLSNALSPLWPWNWDPTDQLRSAGDKLVWVVSNFGAKSGYHAWTPEGHTWIHWSSNTITGNQIKSSVSGEVFGWYDARGYIWHGTNPPPLLLSNTGCSVDGGSNWSSYVDGSGSPVQAVQREAWGTIPMLVVNPSDGHLLLGGVGQAFRPLDCPTHYAFTLFFDECTGLLVSGTGSSLFYTRLPQLSSAGIFTDGWREGPDFRLAFAGRPGNVHEVEYSEDLVSWLPLSTNAVSAAGIFQAADRNVGVAAHRYYRARLIQSAP